MAVIHWVHLSDIHYNKVGTQAKLMRQKLPSYIQALSNESEIHYVFFTGDIRFAPNGGFPDDCVSFFDQVREAANLKKDNLYVVIGNHDVDRKDITRHDAISELFNTYFESDSVISDNLASRLKSGRTEYFSILQRIINNKSYTFHNDSCTLHFPIETEYVNILHLDSTLTYEKERQNGFLLGTYSLIDALESCNSKKPTIILSHYSLDAFAPTEQKAILRILKQYHVQLWLSGHKHTDIIYKDRDFFFVAHSGNMTFERQTSPGFVEGFLDTSTGVGKLHVHKWNESTDWALYQTLVERTDLKGSSCKDRTTYPFIIDDWCNANAIRIPTFSYQTEAVKTFIMAYRGKTILLSTLQKHLGIEKEDLLASMLELSDQGLVWLIDADKFLWKIIKK